MKICCFGSLNLDMVFSVKNFVQPKETIQSNGLAHFAGGKGLNQAMAIRKSGAQVMMAGSIGPDGQMLLDVCDQNGLDRRFVRTTSTNTGVAVIQVNGSGENCIILYDGANRSNDQAFMDEVLAELQAGDLLILQNEVNDLAYLMKMAGQRKIRIILNPSPFEEALKELPLELCAFLIVNEVEGQALSGKNQPQAIVDTLQDKYPDTGIILTYGAQGVYYATSGGKGYQRAFQVEAVDTTGAGDAFTGYFIGMIAKGMVIQDAITMAQKAAAISVTRQGAAGSIPYIEEVIEAMAKDKSTQPMA